MRPLLLCLRAALPAAALWAAAPAKADPQCECRRPGGGGVQLGERACLRAPDGGWRVALCGMALNNTSWRFTQETCAPTARGGPAETPEASKILRLSPRML